MRARSVRQDEGVDAFQALHRVLYHSAKQDPERRSHALYDKLTRRGVMWRAWVDVATNQGALRSNLTASAADLGPGTLVLGLGQRATQARPSV